MLEYCWFNGRNKPQWNFKRNSYIFIQENVFENVVCKMASILSRPQCVNTLSLTHNVVMTWIRGLPCPSKNIPTPDCFTVLNQAISLSGVWYMIGCSSLCAQFIQISMWKLLTCTEFCVNCSAFWAHATGGNLHCFSKTIDSPLAQLNACR